MQICDRSGLNNEEVAKLGEFLSTHAQAPAMAVSLEPDAKVDATETEKSGQNIEEEQPLDEDEDDDSEKRRERR